MTIFRRYKDLDAVNYSALKNILSESFRYAKRQSDAMDLGSLVDCKLTTPMEFDEQFAVISSKPGDKPKQITDYIFETGQAIAEFDGLDREYLFSLMDMFKYRTTYKDLRDSRRFEFFKDDVFNYYTERLANGDKVIVDESDVVLADRIATSIQNGRFTSPFHNLPFGVKVYNQTIVRWVTSGLDCKALLDRVIENTTDNPIVIGSYALPGKSVLVIDYKTMQGKASQFSKQMWKYRYDIQGSFYSYGINQWIAYNRPDLKLADFFFIVESTTTPGTPMAYRLSDMDKQIGRWGAIRSAEGFFCAGHIDGIDPDLVANNFTLDVLGWEQALNLYKWHQQNDEWEYSREVVESNGIIETNQYL